MNLKKILFVPFLGFVGLSLIWLFFIYKKDITNLVQIGTKPEVVVSYEKRVSVTPDEIYSYGAFCRVNRVPSQETFVVTFGGANAEVQKTAPANLRFGGAEGGNGYSYKIFDKDFIYTGETGIIHAGGGDAASVMAEGYYYFLAGTPPNDWIIKKIDPASWEVIDSVFVDIETETEVLNDMMIAYVNGYIMASSLYDEDRPDGENQKNSGPTFGKATHNRLFDTDLNFLKRFVLDDVPHINGSYVVYAHDTYHVITSTAFFGDLIVMRYDSDWEFIDSKTLDAGAQWSQGAVYDEVTDRFYVAFLDIPLTPDSKIDFSETINTVLGIYDKDWNLIEKINVSGFEEHDKKMPGRPSVVLEDGKIYVSYDVSTFSASDGIDLQDWQCTVDIFEVNF
jgi:hypothetical protein